MMQRPTRTPKLAPYLLVKEAAGLVRFLQSALDGEVTFEVKRSNGTLAHVEVTIADSLIMLAEVPPGRATFPAMLHLYVTDADTSYDRAIRAGAKSIQAPEDQHDGDRRGGVLDAWGNEWWFTTPPKAP